MGDSSVLTFYLLIYSSRFVVINLSYGLATPIAANLFLPVFYNMRVTSAYEVSLCSVIKIAFNDF